MDREPGRHWLVRAVWISLLALLLWSIAAVRLGAPVAGAFFSAHSLRSSLKPDYAADRFLRAVRSLSLSIIDEVLTDHGLGEGPVAERVAALQVALSLPVPTATQPMAASATQGARLPSPTPSPYPTGDLSPSRTIPASVTETSRATDTHTPSPTPTLRYTASPNSATQTHIAASTLSITLSPGLTPTANLHPSSTPPAGDIPSQLPPSSTSLPTATRTVAPTSFPTKTPSPTATRTPPASPTASKTAPPSATASASATRSPTPNASAPDASPTASPVATTKTPTPSATRTSTATAMPSPTSSSATNPMPTPTVVIASGIAHEESQTGGSSGSTSVSTSGSLSAATNHLYLAAISIAPDIPVDTVSGLGLLWTRLKAQCSGRVQSRTEVWMAIGSPGGNGIVTATLSSTPWNAVIAVARYSGVDRSSPIGAVASANTLGPDGACSGGSDNGSPGVNLTVSQGGSWAYGALGWKADNDTFTTGPGYNLRAFVRAGTGGKAADVAIEDKPVTATSTVTVNGYLSGTSDWAVVAIEIKPRP